MADVEIKVKANLTEISDGLKKISKEAKEASGDISDAGKQNAETLDNVSNKAKRNVFDLRAVSKDFLGDISQSLKKIGALSAAGLSFKFAKGIKEAIDETNDLTDTFKKLGNVFDMSKEKFGSMQSGMVKGLSLIGQSAGVVTDTLMALKETPVRGEENITEYAKTSAKLASISGTKEDQGAIAKGLSDVLLAQGKDPNDLRLVRALGETVRNIYNATGRDPQDILTETTSIFQKMPKDLRNKITPDTLGTIFAARTAGGENTTKFIEEYMGKSKLERMVFDQFGGGNLIKDGKLDVEQFKKFSQNATSLIGIDPRKSAEVLGISPEAAEGMMRLGERLESVNDIMKKISNPIGDLNDQFKDSLTLTEALSSNFSRLNSSMSDVIPKANNFLTDLFKGTAETDFVNSAAGSASVGAVGAGAGLVGAGAGLGMIPAAAAAAAGSVALGALSIGAGVGGALGYFAQPGVSSVLDRSTTGTTSEGYTGNSIDRLIFKLDELLGSPTGISDKFYENKERDIKVKIEMEKTENLRARIENRGASY